MKLNGRRTPNVPAVLGELDAQQLRFLEEFITLGGRPQDGETAAFNAGYGDGTLVSARRCANTLLASPKITKALRKAVAQRFNTAVGAAFNTLLDVCTNPRAPANARISAAQAILDRSEFGPVPSRAQGNPKEGGGIEDLLDKVDRLAREQAAKDGAPTILDVTPRHGDVSE